MMTSRHRSDQSPLWDAPRRTDTYFSAGSQYNTPSWRALATCQEIGHTFGLDHQDTNFNNPNLGTCMDYTSNPDGPPANTSPNRGDYDELLCIYDPGTAGRTLSTTTHSCTGTGHLDSFTTIGQLTKMPAAMTMGERPRFRSRKSHRYACALGQVTFKKNR